MRVYYDLFKNLPRIIVARDFCPTQLTQMRCKDVVKTSYFWSQSRLRLVRNGSRDNLFLKTS